MNPETIFNLFPICENGIITCIGFRTHKITGTDSEKEKFLKERVEEDKNSMSLCCLPPEFIIHQSSGKKINGITLERFNNLSMNGTNSVLFEKIFEQYDAPETPLSLSTMVVDGEIRISKKMNLETKPTAPPTFQIEEHVPVHYLDKYLVKNEFNMFKLIEDDFLSAIKILNQEGKYVSSIKLIMSAIDSFAFLEYGDERGIFKRWLDEFCDLDKTNLTSDEVWEYRNAIVHMTNTQSRKVIDKKVKSLSFYVSKTDRDYLTNNGESKYFNLPTFLDIIIVGLSKWFELFDKKREKFGPFFERYDLIVSENRMGKLF